MGIPKIPLTKFKNVAPPSCNPTNVYVKDATCLLKPGAVSWIILIARAYQFVDTLDAAEWATAITAGNIMVIPVSGKLNPPEMVTIDGKGALRKQNISNKFGFDVKCDYPDTNMSLMNRINYQGRNFGVLFVYNDDSSATKTAYAAMQDDAADYAYVDLMAGFLNENPLLREWNIKGEWHAKFMPQVLDIPTSILDAA